MTDAKAMFEFMAEGDSDQMDFEVHRNVPPRQAGNDAVFSMTFSADAMSAMDRAMHLFVGARLYRHLMDREAKKEPPPIYMRVRVSIEEVK